MKSKMKRVIIALIFPLIITGVICGVMFMRNSYDVMIVSDDEVQDDTAVAITKANWKDYFTIHQDVELIRDEMDEVIMVQYVTVVSLKDEYKERIIAEKEQSVSFAGDCEIRKKAYEITDAKAGEWKILGDTNSAYYYADGSERYTVMWSTAFEMEDYVLKSELWSGSTPKDPLALEVPESDWEIDGVKGTLYLEQE